MRKSRHVGERGAVKWGWSKNEALYQGRRRTGIKRPNLRTQFPRIVGGASSRGNAQMRNCTKATNSAL
jgi:hypothetical protein